MRRCVALRTKRLCTAVVCQTANADPAPTLDPVLPTRASHLVVRSFLVQALNGSIDVLIQTQTLGETVGRPSLLVNARAAGMPAATLFGVRPQRGRAMRRVRRRFGDKRSVDRRLRVLRDRIIGAGDTEMWGSSCGAMWN
jgi:hypothetical protein